MKYGTFRYDTVEVDNGLKFDRVGGILRIVLDHEALYFRFAHALQKSYSK